MVGRAYQVGTALAVVLAASTILAGNAHATLVGATYDYSVSTTGTTVVTGTSLSGTLTAPSYPQFCIGPPNNCAGNQGITASFTFANVSPTLNTITFNFAGSSTPLVTGSFVFDLGNFVTTDGETITNVTYKSGNLLNGGDFTNVSWNGTDAIFTGTPNSSGQYYAINGVSVVFDVATSPSVPEPGSLAIFGTALLGLIGFEGIRRRRKHSGKGGSLEFREDDATPV